MDVDAGMWLDVGRWMSAVAAGYRNHGGMWLDGEDGDVKTLDVDVTTLFSENRMCPPSGLSRLKVASSGHRARGFPEKEASRTMYIYTYI